MNKEELKNQAAYAMEVENRKEQLSDEDRCFLDEMTTSVEEVMKNYFKAVSVGDSDAMTTAINEIIDKVKDIYGDECTAEDLYKLLCGSEENFKRLCAISEEIDPESAKKSTEYLEDMKIAKQYYDDSEFMTISNNTVIQRFKDLEQVSDYLQDEEM